MFQIFFLPFSTFPLTNANNTHIIGFFFNIKETKTNIKSQNLCYHFDHFWTFLGKQIFSHLTVEKFLLLGWCCWIRNDTYTFVRICFFDMLCWFWTKTYTLKKNFCFQGKKCQLFTKKQKVLKFQFLRMEMFIMKESQFIWQFRKVSPYYQIFQKRPLFSKLCRNSGCSQVLVYNSAEK